MLKTTHEGHFERRYALKQVEHFLFKFSVCWGWGNYINIIVVVCDKVECMQSNNEDELC
jgi:hypothetical protein